MVGVNDFRTQSQNTKGCFTLYIQSRLLAELKAQNQPEYRGRERERESEIMLHNEIFRLCCP